MTTQEKTDSSDRKPRPGKFVWFEHVTRDAKKAQAFYDEVLGGKTQPWGDSTYGRSRGSTLSFRVPQARGI